MINKNALESIQFLSKKFSDERNFAFERLNAIINQPNLTSSYIIQNMESLIEQIAELEKKGEIISGFIDQIVSQSQTQAKQEGEIDNNS